MYNGRLNDLLKGQEIMNSFENFCADEDGAVTVDWVVLTAAVVGLAVLAFTNIRTGAEALTNSTANFLAQQDPSQFQSLDTTP